jgi:hypothetical protein
MPQRPLSPEEVERLKDTPFGRMKRILEERRVPEKHLRGYPEHMHRELHFRIIVERCEFDNADPYLRISEATRGIGFIFDLNGNLAELVNYK